MRGSRSDSDKPQCPLFAARICRNTESWTIPAGKVREAETASWAASNGFGLEEWLFNYRHGIDQWQYGFLEPVNRSRNARRRAGEEEVDSACTPKIQKAEDGG